MTDQKSKGMYRKFNVSRVDGRDAPGGDRERAEYVVLDMTYDPFARAALTAYADACKAEYPKLTEDLRARYGLPMAPIVQGETRDFEDDEMLLQIEQMARKSCRRHSTACRGQIATHCDSVEWHYICAAIAWADAHPLQ